MSAVELPASTPAPGTPLLRTLVLCDLADSTALVERLGDQRAAALMRKHDRLARDLVLRHGGREIDKTDGFLVLFERPINGVAFALDYQRELVQLGKEEQQPLRARVGLHVGDVVMWDNAPHDVAHGAKPVELEGLVKPVAARLAGLALPGQILASGIAAGLSQRAHGELGEKATSAQWINHGRYRFKGVPEPLPVYEIGEAGIAPLKPPPWSGKAHREVPWWRTPASMAVEAVLTISLVGSIAWYLLRPPPAIAFAERDWVVFGDLQNRTQLPVLKDSLDVALRVGLSQSSYVNLLSDLRVRETLKRMGQPTEAVVDREMAVQVALRDGARAVILPGITEVGKRLRLSAEVVDPKTGVTVYSEFVDSQSIDAVLPAVDELLRRLRGRLGESLAAIGNASPPLGDITTHNLDALRAYALAEKSFGSGKVDEAQSLLRQALELDHDFAMAMALQGIIHHFVGARLQAKQTFEAAIALKTHLSTREQLLVEAWKALDEDAAKAKEKWLVLRRLYPDSVDAMRCLALLALWYDNDPTEAAKLYAEAFKIPHAKQATTQLGLAVAQLEVGDVRAAQKNATESLAAGVVGPHFEAVLFALNAREHAVALKLLQEKSGQLPAALLAERWLREAVVAVDRGHLADADKALAAADAAMPDDPLYLGRHRKVALYRSALALFAARKDAVRGLSAFIEQESARIVNAVAANERTADSHLALAGMIAARAGHYDLARKAVSAAQKYAQVGGFNSVAGPWKTAQCEANAAEANVADCLRPLLDGHEFFQTHAALFHAYAEANQLDPAQRELTWMETHRGRGIAEMEGLTSQLVNVLSVQEAQLRRAELLETNGARPEALASVKSLLESLRDADADWPLLRRAQALQTRLLQKQEG